MASEVSLEDLLAGWSPEKTGSPVVAEMARRLKALGERHREYRGACLACSGLVKDAVEWPCETHVILNGGVSRG